MPLRYASRTCIFACVDPRNTGKMSFEKNKKTKRNTEGRGLQSQFNIKKTTGGNCQLYYVVISSDHRAWMLTVRYFKAFSWAGLLAKAYIILLKSRVFTYSFVIAFTRWATLTIFPTERLCPWTALFLGLPLYSKCLTLCLKHNKCWMWRMNVLEVKIQLDKNNKN